MFMKMPLTVQSAVALILTGSIGLENFYIQHPIFYTFMLLLFEYSGNIPVWG